MKNLIFIILSATFLYSCDNLETVVDLDIPKHDPVLVVNSKLKADSKIKIFVSHSLGAFVTNSPSSIDDATVLLYEDNQFLDTLYADFSEPEYFNYSKNRRQDSVLVHFYKSDILTQTKQTYRLEVSHPLYPSVSASTTVPSGVEIEFLPTNNPLTIKFNFDDDPSQKNFYELKLMARFTQEYDGELINYNQRLEFASNDLSFPADFPFDGFTFYGSKVLFEDALFNGTKKEISIQIVDYETSVEKIDSVYLQFTELSSEAYSYQNSRNDQLDGGVAGIFGGEVIPVFSNVENGLGVFISVNTQKIILENLSE
jgi:hypothetical protein